MFAFVRAGVPARSLGRAGVALVSLIGLGLSGCSSSKVPEGTQVFSWMLSEPPQRVAAAPVIPVEIEDDGLPAQTAPPARIRQMPDDPNAPWSRNYGGPAEAPVALEPDVARPKLSRTAAAETDEADDVAVAMPSSPDGGEDGFPVPQSPEEAGVRPTPISQRSPRGANLQLPGARCQRDGASWLCTR